MTQADELASVPWIQPDQLGRRSTNPGCGGPTQPARRSHMHNPTTASPQHQQCGRGPSSTSGETNGNSVSIGSDCHRYLDGDFYRRRHCHHVEHQAMEVLITLVLIGLVVMLFPYILAAFLAAGTIVLGAIALVFMAIKKIFSR